MNFSLKQFWLILLLLLSPLSFTAQGVDEVTEETLESDWEDEWQDEEADESAIDYFGFIEAAYGRRLQNNPAIHSYTSLNELRGRVELNSQLTDLRFNVSGDLIHDSVIDNTNIKARTAFVDYNLTDYVNFKAGRQILTWGTGDYLFLNDLFPKDWQSFFSGRDDEYLKAPSDSVKASWYLKNSSIQLVWTPEFEADNYINGERFSYFSPMVQRQVNTFSTPIERTSETWSLKIATLLNSVDYALYAYKGYWNTPTGLTSKFEPYFPKLNVYGASIQTPLATGLFNTEVAWYYSVEDRNGKKPFAPNSQFRALIGYEQELVSNLTFSAQYYLEQTQNHRRLFKYSPYPEYEPDRNRQVATIRLRWLTLQQKLTLNFFSFWSPTDKDAYFRPSMTYRHNDKWSFSAGLNVFTGTNDYSFFGQHQDNSNAWLRMRFNY